MGGGGAKNKKWGLYPRIKRLGVGPGGGCPPFRPTGGENFMFSEITVVTLVCWQFTTLVAKQVQDTINNLSAYCSLKSRGGGGGRAPLVLTAPPSPPGSYSPEIYAANL